MARMEAETKWPPPFLGSGTEITSLPRGGGLGLGQYSLPPDPEYTLPMSRPRACRQANLFPVLDSRERNPTCLNLHQTAPTESHLSSPDNVSDTFPLLPPGYVRIRRPGPGPGRLVGT